MHSQSRPATSAGRTSTATPATTCAWRGLAPPLLLSNNLVQSAVRHHCSSRVARGGGPQDKLQKASPNDPNHFSFVTNHSTFSLTTGRNSGGGRILFGSGYRAHRRLAALLTRFHVGLAAHTEPSPPVTRGLHEHWLAQQTRCATERCNCGLQADKWLDCV